MDTSIQENENVITSIIRALVLYHLAEYQYGNSTTIEVNVQSHTFRTSDDGRGHAIDKTIDGFPYLKLVYSQLEYPFGLDNDTPIQLHTIGMSLINALCSELVVTIYKTEKAYIKYYRDGRLNREETKENMENAKGTTIEGKINAELFPGGLDHQDLEQWLKMIKSIHEPLRLLYNEREL